MPSLPPVSLPSCYPRSNQLIQTAMEFLNIQLRVTKGSFAQTGMSLLQSGYTSQVGAHYTVLDTEVQSPH